MIWKAEEQIINLYFQIIYRGRKLDSRISAFFQQQKFNNCAIVCVYHYLAYLNLVNKLDFVKFDYKSICHKYNSKDRCKHGIPVTKVPEYLPDEISIPKNKEWILKDSDDDIELEDIHEDIKRMLRSNIPFIVAYDHHAVVVIGIIDLNEDLKINEHRVEVIDSDNHSCGIGKRLISEILKKKQIRLAYLQDV